ncbi:S1 RNA-binding domain-containing protein [Streptomyces sp. NPDC057307]|uniref:S1 RNA-binding domain-containing protein n=1 Tax=Streptomyces sp. NPDC057307 TaxID=3346096 RepID=UPI00363D7C37
MSPTRPEGADVPGRPRLPFVYRVTKYDPADRDEGGVYAGAEEVISDHGPVEAAYLEAVSAFAEGTGVRTLSVREPQIGPGFAHFGPEPPVDGDGLAGLFPRDLSGFHDGAEVSVPLALELVRVMLRGDGAWCRLEAEGAFAVHVGWDLYVYVGSDVPCEEAVARTGELGLFAERVDVSPYDADYDADYNEPGEQRPADDLFWERLSWCVASRWAGLLEENHVDNGTRWHLLGDAHGLGHHSTLDTVRARLAPRARLTVWPGLSTDIDAVLATLPEEGLVEVVWEDDEGRVSGVVADVGESAEPAALVAGARAAAVLPMYADERRPLFTAVLPDSDGVLRARWRTEPTRSDRDWAFLRTLNRGQVVTGTVVVIADFGVTFVDIGGFTAMINIPEVSWRYIDFPSDVLTVGQEVTALILDVDRVRERVSLSLKALQEDPLLALAGRVGEVVTGPVTRIEPSGAFVRVEERDHGFEGLLPATELAPDAAPDAARVGDPLTVRITEVDPTSRRILLARERTPATD